MSERPIDAKLKRVFNYPPELPPGDFKFVSRDVSALIEIGGGEKLSPPEFRSVLSALDSFNRLTRRSPNTGVTDAELEAKPEPWKAAVVIVAEKTQAPLKNGLVVDEKVRFGVTAAEEALGTFTVEPGEVDSIRAFTVHIHNAVDNAWEKATIKKFNRLTSPEKPKTNGVEVNPKLSESEAAKEPSVDDSENPSGSENLRIMNLYLSDITKHKLLKPEEEIELAKQLDAGKAAKEKLKTNDTSIDRTQLEVDVEAGARARQKLVESNLRLVINVARKYLDRGLPLLDLIQEGNIGLDRGIDKYDWTKGYRVSTYTYWWIRQAVTRAIATQSRIIDLPVHVGEQLGKISTVSADLFQELQREPTNREIAERLGTTQDKIDTILQAAAGVTSLEAPVGEARDSKKADFIADDSEEELHATVINSHLAEDLDEAFIVAKLTPNEAFVVRCRFGFDENGEQTLKEAGEGLGVSRERARQLEVAAMRKLKNNPKAQGILRPYLSP